MAGQQQNGTYEKLAIMFWLPKCSKHTNGATIKEACAIYKASIMQVVETQERPIKETANKLITAIDENQKNHYTKGTKEAG